MKTFKIIFLLSLIACMFSCNAHKKWMDKGLRKNWIDTTLRIKKGSVRIDTLKISAEVDTFFQNVDHFIERPCDEQGKITPAAKKQMATKAKKELVAAIQTHTLLPMRHVILEGGGQLTLWYDSTKAQIDYNLKIPGQQLICPEVTFKEACLKVWWLLLFLPFSGIIGLMIILYFVKK